MVLSDREIEQLCGVIDPFNSEQLKPASYDLRLGNRFIRFPFDSRDKVITLGMPPTGDASSIEVEDDGELIIEPGEFILAHTVERVNMPDHLVARVEGKSTTGRSGLLVHATAGYIDPGYKGVITLELYALRRCKVSLRPGMPIAQLSLLQMTSKAKHPYQGRYQNADSVEPAKAPITLTGELLERCVEAPACPQDVEPPEQWSLAAGISPPSVKGATRPPTETILFCQDCDALVVQEFNTISVHVGHQVVVTQKFATGSVDAEPSALRYGGKVATQYRPVVGDPHLVVTIGGREFGHWQSA